MQYTGILLDCPQYNLSPGQLLFYDFILPSNSQKQSRSENALGTIPNRWITCSQPILEAQRLLIQVIPCQFASVPRNVPRHNILVYMWLLRTCGATSAGTGWLLRSIHSRWRAGPCVNVGWLMENMKSAMWVCISRPLVHLSQTGIL